MVIFTSPELKERIEKLRKGKPTKIITLDLNKKFKHILNKIKTIQDSDEFQNRISPHQIKNIEYWSNYYVLVNNLKTFFVNLAINSGLVKNDNGLFSWVDFGYVRNIETLNGLSEWSPYFDKENIHFFSIDDVSELKSESDVYHAIFNNKPYIIGGGIVGSKESWAKFNKILFNNQKDFIRRNIIDDDQGFYLISHFRNKEFIKFHYLGKDNWFGLFKKFN